MNEDAVDRALRSDTIEPSSGFTLRVMDAVRAEAEVPPPLRFPWGRLGLGVAACAALSAAATWLAPDLGRAWDGVAPRLGVALQLGQAALGVAVALTLARLPRLFVRS